jgi:AmmeMemoRadiSam system protein B
LADFPLAEYPRLRPVDMIPVSDRGRRGLALRDPTDPGGSILAVYDGAVDVVAMLDGSRTLQQLSIALRLRGGTITESQLRTFLTRLDEAGLLEGARAAARYAQRRSAFLEQPLRPAAHAGGAYPDGADELPRMLAAGYVHRDGPGSLPKKRNAHARPVRAAIAPHVDLHRGAPTYSWAYQALAEAQPAELYVILGTCHTPVEGHFAATRKAYDTPLGPAPTDSEFLHQLGKAWGRDLFAGEFSHAGEHSIEFQTVYLRSLRLVGADAAAVAPILCDSLHSMVPRSKSPGDVSLVASFVDALRRSIDQDGRRITLIAAVDLAHVGRRFGDQWLVDAQRQATVATSDREMLDLLLSPDADAYYAHVMRDGDARRICGFTPIYVLAALMQAERRGGELLRYTQWVDTDLSSSVTFASAIYR